LANTACVHRVRRISQTQEGRNYKSASKTSTLQKEETSKTGHKTNNGLLVKYIEMK